MVSTSEGSKAHQGFTIVELLIVIVVIGILAAISFVVYSGLQIRALEARRNSDMSFIVKALEIYKAQTGEYPKVRSNTRGGWERSAIDPDRFLEALKTAGVVSSVPVDPINDAPQGFNGPESTFTSYKYYRYPPGYAGCDLSAGDIYVLTIEDSSRPVMTSSPGLICGSYSNKNYRGGRDVYWSGRSTNQ